MRPGSRLCGLACVCLAALLSGLTASVGGPARLLAAAERDDRAVVVAKTIVPFRDVQSILQLLLPPPGVRVLPPGTSSVTWPDWVRRRNREIRARLDQGDDDSIVNFWLFGTSFTKEPRLTERVWSGADDSPATWAELDRRLSDLIAGAAEPGANERLQFVRHVLDRHEIDLSTPTGRERAADYLQAIRARMVREITDARSAGEAAMRAGDPDAQFDAYANFYRVRGLSSDTSLFANFAVDQAIGRMAVAGTDATGPIRRIAIVGPGLDFTDKGEGYDFYPPQSMQPFALVDSLVRAGLADAARIDVTTFDVSPRIIRHLRSAVERARLGTGYRLQLPLDAETRERQWTPGLVTYAAEVGNRVGDEIAPLPPPADLANVRLRAVSVRPAIVRAVTPRDLNIVVERLPLAPDARFDLIVATNILVYYDAFEQALALSNVAAMLRPGGWFLTNSAVPVSAPLAIVPGLGTRVVFDRQGQMGDQIFLYRRP